MIATTKRKPVERVLSIIDNRLPLLVPRFGAGPASAPSPDRRLRSLYPVTGRVFGSFCSVTATLQRMQQKERDRGNTAGFSGRLFRESGISGRDIRKIGPSLGCSSGHRRVGRSFRSSFAGAKTSVNLPLLEVLCGGSKEPRKIWSVLSREKERTRKGTNAGPAHGAEFKACEMLGSSNC